MSGRARTVSTWSPLLVVALLTGCTAPSAVPGPDVGTGATTAVPPATEVCPGAPDLDLGSAIAAGPSVDGSYCTIRVDVDDTAFRSSTVDPRSFDTLEIPVDLARVSHDRATVFVVEHVIDSPAVGAPDTSAWDPTGVLGSALTDTFVAGGSRFPIVADETAVPVRDGTPRMERVDLEVVRIFADPAVELDRVIVVVEGSVDYRADEASSRSWASTTLGYSDPQRMAELVPVMFDGVRDRVRVTVAVQVGFDVLADGTLSTEVTVLRSTIAGHTPVNAQR